jgi:riboflavin synthase
LTHVYRPDRSHRKARLPRPHRRRSPAHRQRAGAGRPLARRGQHRRQRRLPDRAADLAAETLARTTLGSLPTGAVLNLELPTPAGSPLGGHVVQGHVDATATVVSFDPLAGNPDTTDWRLTLELPAVLAAAVVSQGSITVDGISLTVAKVRPAQDRIFVEIAIIPHTCAATNLRALAPGSSVNIETDVLAKYAAQMASTSNPEPALTVASLLASGY